MYFHLCDMHELFFHRAVSEWFFFFLPPLSAFCEANGGTFSPLIFAASRRGAERPRHCAREYVCARVFTSSRGASCFHVRMFQVRFSMLPWEPLLSVLLSYRKEAPMMEAYRNQTQSQTLKGCKPPPPHPPPLKNKILVYLTRLPTSYKVSL